jgi:hypothetical protein
MYPELQDLLYQAEREYLEDPKLEELKTHASYISLALQTYEILRDREIEIFQAVADGLVNLFPNEQEQVLKSALKHWLLVMRYSAMAMLTHNPEFLQHRLLEWLTGIVQAGQTANIEQTLCKLLQNKLAEVLEKEQLQAIQPFIELSKTTLFNGNKVTGGSGK